jgi:Fe2+ or Zn2+ uptake regulation protein
MMMDDRATPSPQDLFARHGLRCTRQRLAIYEHLLGDKTHPTADDLHRKVTRKLAGVSLATVYNTLEALCDAGLAQKLPAGENGSAHYDANVDGHLHTRCTRTGQVADVPDELSDAVISRIPPELLARIEAETGFDVRRIQIELIGESTRPPAKPPTP